MSRLPYDALNVSLNTGDSIDRVQQNRRMILESMGGSSLVFMNQVHGDHILVMDGELTDSGQKGIPYGEGDAIITKETGKNIVIQTADCQPVFLLDPVRKAIAAIHSGWRGSVSNITGKTVDLMREKFNCDPTDIMAGIGPSLGPCCGEFIHFKEEIPEPLWKYKDQRTGYFDFWSLTFDQLTQKGVSGKNILNSGICTRCNSDRFFSYRKHKQTGRFAAVIGLI